MSDAKSTGEAGAGTSATVGKCPICGKPTQHAVRPFCSRHCADIDLGRWASGTYVIVGGQADADEDGDEGFAKDVADAIGVRSDNDNS